MINKIVSNGMYFMFPKIVNIELTSRCPLECYQCFKDNAHNVDMDIDFLNRILNEASKSGTALILLSGGEPLLYEYIIDIVEKIKELGMDVYISTSGYEITDIKLKKLKNAGLDILYVSLNGSTKSINSLSRDGYDLAINAIKLASNNDLKCRINWVARHDNIDDFENLMQLVKKFGVNGIDVLSNKPNKEGHVISPLSKEDLIRLYNIIIQSDDFISYQNCFTYLRNKLSKKKQNSILNKCSGGRYSMAVFANKSFSYCPHVFQKNNYELINDFWSNDENLNDFRSYNFMKCNQCVNCKYYSSCTTCFLKDKNNLECICFERA